MNEVRMPAKIAGMDIEGLKENPRLAAIVETLRRWNRTVNCISAGDLGRIWERHIADSEQIADLIPNGAKVVDIGSGAGLPGLVLAAVRPDITLASVESDQRKAVVQRAAIRAAGISNAEVLGVRIENAPPLAAGVVVSRAFGTIAAILDASRAHIGPDSQLILHKTMAAAGREIDDARRRWSFDSGIIPSKISPEGLIAVMKAVKPLT